MNVPRCATTADPGVAVAGPLSEIRVIELGSFIAGPFCGQMLADLGAEVIKIEPPGKGDTMRQWGNARSPNGQSLWWSVIGRNKHSVTLDLRQPEGQQILRELVREADVVVENFRPGTLEGWGIGPAALRAENPDLIVARVSGFGQTGPYSQKAGFGSVAEALSGLRALCGEADRMPSRMGISIGDSLAGLFATIGVLSALLARGRAGGQDIDVSIVESVLAVMESSVPDFAGAGIQRQRSGPILAGIAPSNLYPTADGVPILIAANADGLFRSLALAMDQPELAERPEFATHAARGQNQQMLDGLIADWTETRPLTELLHLMERHGIPAGPVNDIGAALADPHLRARNAFVDMPDKDMGQITMQNVAPRLSQTPGGVRWTGRGLGADTAEILEARLGLGRDEIADLRARGIA